MTAASAVAVAVTFSWLGIVSAISFVETPLKFRAPGVTLSIGLGIGRLVFRALNLIEAVLAATVLVAVIIDGEVRAAALCLGIGVIALLLQILLIRPRLARRTAAVLNGQQGETRSRAHLGYVALELIKVAALLVGGVLLLVT